MKQKLQEPFLSQQEKKNIIKTDLLYLQSMKTDRLASYTSLDKANISRIEKRKLKVRKEISKPSCSSVMTCQEISDIPLGDYCNSGSDVASFTDFLRNVCTSVLSKQVYHCFYLLIFLKTTG